VIATARVSASTLLEYRPDHRGLSELKVGLAGRRRDREGLPEQRLAPAVSRHTMNDREVLQRVLGRSSRARSVAPGELGSAQFAPGQG